MRKSAVVSNWLSRAKSFWGWFIKKSPAFIVLTSLTVVSVFGLGVGGTLAATGVIPNPFASPVTKEAKPPAGDTNRKLTEKEFMSNEYQDALPPRETQWNGTEHVSVIAEWLPGSSWTNFGPSGAASYRWSTTTLHTRIIGACPTDSVGLLAYPPNFGYLSDASVNGKWVAWASSIGVDPCRTGQKYYGSWMVSDPVGKLKCFNFSEVWIDISGLTPQAGFYKIPIPENIPKVDCPLGSENNDPSKFLGEFGRDVYERLKDYPEAVITPPGLNRPQKIEWGPYVPSTPTPSPTPTTESSPTTTPETSQTPTTEPSPTPTSP